MPDQVPYQPYSTKQESNAPGQFLTEHASPNAFGANIAEAVHGLGQEGMQIAEARQKTVNELRANDASTAAMQKAAKIWDQYGQLEGRAAHDRLDEFQQKFIDNYHSTINDPTLNEQAKGMVARSAQNLTERYMGHAANYADTQLRHWQATSNADRANELVNQATLMRNQPDDVIQGHIEQGAQHAKEVMVAKGSNPANKDDALAIQAEQAKFRGGAYVPLIKQLALEGQLDKASRLFQTNRAQMDTRSQVEAETWLHPRILDAQVEKSADEIIPMPGEGKGVTPSVQAAASATGVDPKTLMTFRQIESGGRANAVTGGYKGHFQLSDSEFQKYGGGNIFNPNDNAMAAAKKLKVESGEFKDKFGREPAPWELYLVHQQGWGGAVNHIENPNRPAWQNMADTGEGRSKGDAWAKKAIWGNIPDQDKAKFGSVENVSSAQFMSLWQDKVARIGGNYGAVGDIPAPDKHEALRRAAEMSQGNPELEKKLFSEVNRRASMWGNAGAAEKQDIHQRLSQLEKMASDGVDNLDFSAVGLTEERIRSALPAPQAERIIEENRIQKDVTTQIHGLNFATPEEVRGYLQDVQSGQGAKSMIEHYRKNQGATGPLAAGASPDVGEDKAEHYRTWSKMSRVAASWAQNRQQVLSQDPAAWTANEPTVSKLKDKFTQVAQDYKTGKASLQDAQQAFDAYSTAHLAIQGNMGVPEENRHVLTRSVAEQKAQAIAQSKDPKADMETGAKEYGASWPHVFHDLTTLGGLSTKYEALQYLDATNARILGGMLEQHGKSGKGEESGSQLKDLMGTSNGVKVKTEIDKNVEEDATMHGFLRSLKERGTPDSQREDILNSVKLLAYGHNFEGKDVSQASKDAVNAFTDKFSFTRDNAMIPKDKYDKVTTSMKDVVSNLNESDIQTPQYAKYGEKGYLSEKEYVDRIKSSSVWVNNKNGNGVVLKSPFNDFVKDKNGNPITVLFANPDANVKPKPPQQGVIPPESAWLGGPDAEPPEAAYLKGP